jgi:hypothetical protein
MFVYNIVEMKLDIVFLTTFILFAFEALLHYNIGKGNGKNKRVEDMSWPTKKEWCKIVLVVGIFSYGNSVIVEFLEKRFPEWT